MTHQTQLSVGASLSLVASGAARTMPACGVVPSSREDRLYEFVRAVRVEVFERIRDDRAHVDWLVSITPIGDNDVEWPEYVEWATGDDPGVLIDLTLPDGSFAPGVFVPLDELDDWLDLGVV